MAGAIDHLCFLGSATRSSAAAEDTKSRYRPSDLLWRDYFRDPSQWWDYRIGKLGPAYPDFKHKVSKKSLWINRRSSPSWVVEELRRRGLAMSAQAQDAEKIRHYKAHEVTAFVALLRACAKSKDLYRGSRVHDDILQSGLLEQCSDALVNMYAKCGALTKAKDVLNMQKSRTVFSWTALISGYVRRGMGHDALNCFEQMKDEGLSPDAVTFTCVLKACGSIKAADMGAQIHEEIDRQGLLGNNIVLGNALVDMYANCGALAKACQVLEELPSRDVISWNTLIAGYVQKGQGEQALNCFEKMQDEGLSPDAVTFSCILKACGTIGDMDKGEQIHDEIARQGLLGNNIVLGTALVDMYAKCGALTKARQVFEELPSRDVISWNALIVGYAQQGQGEQALDCLERMEHEGLSPDVVTFACILKACGTIGASHKGERVHNQIARAGLLGSNIVLGNALVDMYVKCGALAKARQVLEELPCRNAVSWNSLIAGYAQQGQGEQALNCFERMEHEGLSPDAVTFACILKACGSIRRVDKGEQIHDKIVRQGLLGHNIVLGNALVDMYARCGALAKSEHVLAELPFRDVVSWNALISGYVQEGEGEQALNCFERMQQEGFSPDAVTFACLLKACGTIGAADKGQQIHDEIARQGLLGNNIVLGTALIDMYAKCGALAKARRVLEELPSRDVVSWSALIAGYAHSGQGEKALNCLERMQGEGLSPDAATFSCVLTACSHYGLIEDGYRYFVNMSTKYGMKPVLEHYTCMVDLFGRAGHMDKGLRVIQEMPFSDYSVVWSALLGACQKYGDVNVGRWAFEKTVQLGKIDAAAYALMANIYAAASMEEE